MKRALWVGVLCSIFCLSLIAKTPEQVVELERGVFASLRLTPDFEELQLSAKRLDLRVGVFASSADLIVQVIARQIIQGGFSPNSLRQLLRNQTITILVEGERAEELVKDIGVSNLLWKFYVFREERDPIPPEFNRMMSYQSLDRSGEWLNLSRTAESLYLSLDPQTEHIVGIRGNGEHRAHLNHLFGLPAACHFELDF